MSFSVTLQPPLSFRILHSMIPPPKFTVRFRFFRSTIPLQQASRLRISNFSQGGSNLVNDPRRWRRAISSGRGDDDEDNDGEEDDDDEDRSLDLLVRFVHNIFKKTSKRTRRAVRSVLPVSISTKLVGFSVDGILILAFLWVLKAFLEVVCTLGSVVFVSILLIRGIWSGVTYLQEIRNQRVNGLDEDHHTWKNVQPVT